MIHFVIIFILWHRGREELEGGELTAHSLFFITFLEYLKTGKAFLFLQSYTIGIIFCLSFSLSFSQSTINKIRFIRHKYQKDVGMAMANKLHKQGLQHHALCHITMHSYISSCSILQIMFEATYVGMHC